MNSYDELQPETPDRHPLRAYWLDVFSNFGSWLRPVAESTSVADEVPDAVEAFLASETKITGQQVANVVLLPTFSAIGPAAEKVP